MTHCKLESCGKLLVKHANERGDYFTKRKYCNRSCATKARYRSTDNYCKHCGNPLNNGRTHFCNYKCRGAWLHEQSENEDAMPTVTEEGKELEQALAVSRPFDAHNINPNVYGRAPSRPVYVPIGTTAEYAADRGAYSE